MIAWRILGSSIADQLVTTKISLVSHELVAAFT